MQLSETVYSTDTITTTDLDLNLAAGHGGKNTGKAEFLYEMDEMRIKAEHVAEGDNTQQVEMAKFWADFGENVTASIVKAVIEALKGGL